MTEPQFSRPTRDNPMLIGLLVDVSGSMMSSIRSVSGPSKARLESFRDALDNLVKEGKKLCRDEANQEIIPLFQLFAYGFGFGNLVTILLGNKGPKVRDLLDIPGASDSTIAVDRLADIGNNTKHTFAAWQSRCSATRPCWKPFRLSSSDLHEKGKSEQSRSLPSFSFCPMVNRQTAALMKL